MRVRVEQPGGLLREVRRGGWCEGGVRCNAGEDPGELELDADA